MKKFCTLLAGVLIALAGQDLSAQRTCSTMDRLDELVQDDPRIGQAMQEIEDHTQSYTQALSNGQIQAPVAVATIPVVVHVVYNSTSQNISDAQIQSQIAVLNADFRRLNADASQTPSYFSGLAADTQIEFCLASIDPNGAATNGITRTYTSSSSFSDNDYVKYSSNGGKSAWPSSQYLNIWVCNLGGGLLGYAQFPGGPSATDGVVINYRYFGTMGTATAPYDEGRTATHEVGHWLNLRHIWGDSYCGNDYVNDTPTQQQDNGGCPSFPHSTCSNYSDMFMNYMDYTNDGCMNMFSQGQSTRMNAVLAAGGFRNSLLSSPGCGGGGGNTGGYCNSNGQSTSDEWIQSVTIAGVTKNSGNDGGYADFTGTAIPMTQGATISVTLSPDFAGTVYNEYWRIWIDLNQDEDFDDAGELVFDAGSAISSTVAGNFVLPASAATGSTRMRVSMKYNAAPTACETFNYGEVEDYTVEISGACNAPTGLSAGSVTETTAQLSWSGSAASYTVQYRPSGSSSWTSSSVSGTSKSLTGLSSGTTYDWRLRSVCGSVTSSYVNGTGFTTLTPSSAGYCHSQGNSVSDEWIAGVTVGSLVHSSGANGGYADFTSTSVTLAEGASVSVSLTPGFSGQAYNEYWRIWVDLNQDQDFDDAGELLFDAGNVSTGTVTGSLTIPTGTLTGSTRMRVSMKYNGAPTPCESFSYGEVEDYTVNIQAASGGGGGTGGGTGGGGGSSSCADTYEPNDTYQQAITLSANTNVYSFICDANDEDWFRASNASNRKNIKLTLSELADDYDVYLFDPSGTQVGASTNGGTTTETIIYNGGAVGAYWIYIKGYSGASSASQPYKLRFATSKNSFSRTMEEPDQPKFIPELAAVNAISLSPNPAGDFVHINYYTEFEGEARFTLIDLNGRTVDQRVILTRSGNNGVDFDLRELPSGMYLVRMDNGMTVMTKRLVIRH